MSLTVRLLLLATLVCAWPIDGVAQSPEASPPATRQEILLRERQAKAERLEPERASTWESRLLRLQRANFPQRLFTPRDGVFPAIGGMPPGSGFALGVGLLQGATSERLQILLAARYSTTANKALDFQATFPTALSRRPVRLQLDLGYQDLRQVRFYGLGNDASQRDETTFEVESRRARLGVLFEPHRVLSLGLHGGVLNANVSAGARRPSFDERFGPDEFPGSIAQPTFATYGARVGLNLRDRRHRSAGVTVIVDAERYEGHDDSSSDFTRYGGEVQAHMPLGRRNRMLAARVRTSHAIADSGSVVPAYLMETIGGSRTMRGFHEYRYRDARNVLLNLEYRWEVWNYVDFVLFGDAGKVFSRASQLDLSDLQASYGFGIRAFFPSGAAFRIDLARSNEGIKLHIGGGPSF